MLLVFANEADVAHCEAALPPGTLLPAQPEHRTLRMCATAKSFCPHSNFTVGFFLLANSFLTLLQFLWGWQILKFLIPSGKGDKGKKKK